MLEDRRAALCARLKSSRERKGVSLEEIAASTKISRSLLKGLEENDFSRWPQGLYRRSYLRDYLRAIDLPEESIVAEFVRWFPDEKSPLPAASADGSGDGAEESCALSMTLDDDRAARIARARKRIVAATIDAAAVLVLSGVAWWGLHVELSASVAFVALGYYSVATAAFGQGLASRLLEDRSWRRPNKPMPSAEAASQDTLLARIREAKGLTEQPHPSMMRRLASVAFNAALFRMLFFR